jgi:hypothetical protein
VKNSLATKHRKPRSIIFSSRTLLKAMPTPPSLKIDQRVASLESDVKRLDERSLPFAWKAIPIIAGLISIGMGFYVYNYIPKEIATQIAPVSTKADVLAKQVEESGKSTNISAQIDSINKRLDSLEEGLKEVRDKLDRFIDRFVSPSNLRGALKLPETSDPSKQANALLVTQELLEHAQRRRAPLSNQDFKDLALPLISKHYENFEVRKQAWETAKRYATLKSIINEKRFGVPKPPKATQDKQNYFKGVHINLGERDLWKDTVFVNCQIDIDYARAKLNLENVYFINCDFEPMKETEAGKRFFEALFMSTGPTVTAPLLDNTISNRQPS